MHGHDPPLPPDVAKAFGLNATLVPLVGGQHRSWRVGNAVLKPRDQPLDALIWQATVLPTLARDADVRVTHPLRALDGAWTVGGWTAWPFLDDRDDPWWAGDRVAWQEADPPRGPAVLHRLLADLDDASTAEPAQLVHGDLTGNVLIHPQLPPAIIDLSLYWRPAEYASAVVVADALLWHGADRRHLDLSRTPVFPDLVRRALVARLVTDLVRHRDLDSDTTTRYERAAAEVSD